MRRVVEGDRRRAHRLCRVPGGGGLRDHPGGWVDLPDVSAGPRGLLEVLDCDSQARREAARDLGTISRWIKENLVYWRTNTEKRRQVFVDCLKPRGYEIGKG